LIGGTIEGSIELWDIKSKLEEKKANKIIKKLDL